MFIRKLCIDVIAQVDKAYWSSLQAKNSVAKCIQFFDVLLSQKSLLRPISERQHGRQSIEGPICTSLHTIIREVETGWEHLIDYITIGTS